ncbi:hypothetical protein K431DRAFT_281898 [Polychaeton citri CBS 116435]|uniref:Uncharacterized protein n=1 Tax=Polychaeton citri CBS 116435 TaxID=1314669 RepID=A0A9P4UQF2_9PEZI|nr:hypothetical protein K431DRAFT_281898 [Polychaeton citri CBS 116435]
MGTVMNRDFTFVVSTGAGGAQSNANKRRVRSAAALKSWDTRLAGIRKRSDWTRPVQHLKSGRVQRKRRRVASPHEDGSATGVKQEGEFLRSPESQGSASVAAASSSSTASNASPKAGSRRSSATSTASSKPQLVRLTGTGVKRRHVTPEAQRQVETESEEDDEEEEPLPFGVIVRHSGLLTPPDHGSPTSDEVEECQSPPSWQQTLPYSHWWPGAYARPSVPRQTHHFQHADDDDNGSGTYTHAYPVSPLISPCRVGSGQIDPFSCSTTPHKQWFDSILYYMLSEFAPRGWPALRITNEEGLMWENFMTLHALAEPALYYVRLLFATGDLVRRGACQPQTSYWLQERAIKAINEALRDPKRGVADPLILAVGRIALHESMYGDKLAAHTVHRPAQQRMIALRGGMGALNFPPLVKRLMRWADRIMSMQGATERMIPDEDEQTYTLEASVKVLEHWVPREGQALRKKISVADLLQ